MKAAQKGESALVVERVADESTRFHIVGTTPIVLNRMSEKVMRELLMPKGKKTAVEKASSLKHDPIQEFLDSPYIDENESGPTYIQHLASSFKNAISGAALDLPGANKTQIGRLTWVKGERISIYGIPQIFCSVTRSADMNRTPDVRTRAIIPEWAAVIDVSYVTPILRQQTVLNLLASAGITQGIGDWRPQKGKGTYGQFEIVNDDDSRYEHLVKHAGRKQQKAAMASPVPYDRETRELLAWFAEEKVKRGFVKRDEQVSTSVRKRAPNGVHAGT